MAVDAIELPTGEVFTISDWLDIPLYSRIQTTPGQAADVVCFNYVEAQTIPGGAAAAVATMIDTNLDQDNMLPIDEQMVIFSIQIRFDEADSDQAGLVRQADTAAEGMLKWLNITHNTYFEFTVTSAKPRVQGPITEFPIGAGLYWQQTEDIFTGAGYTPTPMPWDNVVAYEVTNGMPTAEAARKLALPIFLPTMQTYRGRYKWPRGALPNGGISPVTEFGLTCFLYGPRQRQVD